MQPSDFQPGFPGVLEPTTCEGEGPDGAKTSRQGLAFVPDQLPPKLDRTALLGRLFDVLDRARSRLVRLDGLVDALPGRTVLLTGMRVREAQASSQIENTFASIQDTALAGLDDSASESPAGEVYRNRLAIEHGLRSKLPICSRLVLEMHRVLITESRHRPGKLRDIQVCIGDEKKGFRHARFVPPPGVRVRELMDQWERFCNPNTPQSPGRETLPYFVELALAHYQFETIHPMSDGNGRLGRALVSLAPVKHGELKHPVCNLSEWVQKNRQEYYDRLLRVSTHGEWEGWVKFFCTALAEQSAADTKRAESLAGVYERYAAKIATARRSMVATKLLEHLFERQVVTVTGASRVMGLTYAAAQKHVQAFEKLGILRALEGVKYDRPYVATGIIRAIQGKDDE